MLTDYELAERDRRKASLNVYGLRSHLGAGQCQDCGSDFGMRKEWVNPNDIDDDRFKWINCPTCNPL